jgi:hypothetical protein
MGQQQLLLLVLGIVIIGLAVVVGIRSFEENKHKAQIDHYTEQAVRLASNAIAWKAQPQAAGGGQNVWALSGMTLGALGYASAVPRDCGLGQCQEAQTGGGEYVFLWDPNSVYPHMGVSDRSYDSDASLLHVAVFVYGPSDTCLRVRLATRETAGADWQYAYTPGGDAALPPGTCTNPW